MDRKIRQLRSTASQFQTREAEGALTIEGYFSVFNSIYELWPGATESVAPGAFSETLGNDIRALVNHDDTLVLGRNKAGTLELREDSHGLWGKIDVNPNDVDAMNLYNRVKRGDVDQCSFGFWIEDEETEFRDDGSIHWTIRKVNLFEVSVCTFPAYESTEVSARKADFAEILKRKKEKRQAELLARLRKVDEHGTESTSTP